jgi:hypothetical protein
MPTTLVSTHVHPLLAREIYGCCRRWECQFLMHDKVLPQWYDKEYTKEGGAEDESDQLANILSRIIGQQAEPVHSRDGRDTENA